MNRSFLSIILLITSFLGIGQVENDSIYKTCRWSVGLCSGVNITTTSYQTVPPTSKTGINSQINIRYAIRNRTFISGGIGFNQFTNYLNISTNSMPWYSNPSPYQSKNKNPFFYIYSLPLYVTFQSKNINKFAFITSVGLEAFYWSDKYSFIENNGYTFKTFLGLKFGAIYKINRKISAFIDTGIRTNWSFRTLTDKYGSSTQSYHHTLGDINCGVFVYF